MSLRPRAAKRLRVHLMWMAALSISPASVGGELAARTEVDFKVIPANGPEEATVKHLLQTQAAILGNPLQQVEDIEHWSTSLTTALRQGGFPIAQVLMTNADWQAIAKGAKPAFVAYPGRISEISIQNSSRVNDARLKRLIAKALCGQPSTTESVCVLQTSRLERATQLLQDLPGVAIDKAPQFSPGAGVGDVKVVFSLAQKDKPIQADAIVDNQGIPSTGSYRFGVTASGNNYFGAGESYAFTLMMTDKKMWTGSLTGSMPIFDDGLRATAGITRQQYAINAGTPVTGVATTAQAGVLYPFTRGLDLNIWGSLAYLHSQTKTDYEDYDFSTHSTIDSLRLSVQADNGDRAKQLRTNQFSGEAALTLGHQRNDDPALDQGPQRAGNYVKATGTGFGTYAITASGNLFVSGRLSSQLTNRNLDPSEKLQAGGPTAVRAYRADEVSFDDGVIVNLGLYQRFPIATGHQLQLGIFSDYAIGRVNHKPWAGWESSYIGVPDVTNTRTLAGYGLSVDWLTPFGATISVAVSRPYGFASSSWVEPGKKPLQYWLSVTFSH